MEKTILEMHQLSRKNRIKRNKTRLKIAQTRLDYSHFFSNFRLHGFKSFKLAANLLSQMHQTPKTSAPQALLAKSSKNCQV